MKDEIIKYKTAILAKEKGFTTIEPYMHPYGSSYTKDGQFHDRTGAKVIFSGMEIYEAPTQSLLQKWLREIHNINVYCIPCEHNESLWYHNIASSFKVFTGTYESALEAGLVEGLKLIENA